MVRRSDSHREVAWALIYIQLACWITRCSEPHLVLVEKEALHCLRTCSANAARDLRAEHSGVFHLQAKSTLTIDQQFSQHRSLSISYASRIATPACSQRQIEPTKMAHIVFVCAAMALVAACMTVRQLMLCCNYSPCVFTLSSSRAVSAAIIRKFSLMNNQSQSHRRHSSLRHIALVVLVITGAAYLPDICSGQAAEIKLPILRTIEPAMGPLTGGTDILIVGDNFVPERTFCKFSHHSALVAPFVVTSSRISCSVPASEQPNPNRIEVEVTNDGGYSFTTEKAAFYFAGAHDALLGCKSKHQ